MKAVVAFLLGLLTISYGQTTDSPDDDSVEVIGLNSESHEGISVGVFLNVGESEAPQITISSDKSSKVYCLTFESVYEATFDEFDTCNTDCDYTVVAGSEVELGSNCAVTEVTASTSFSIDCTLANSATLSLLFEYTASDSEPGVEYVITIENYDFISTETDAKLVIEQSLENCTGERESAEDDDEDGDDEDGDDEDGDDEDGDDDEEDRRRLEDDGDDDEDGDDESDSNEEEDGVSSDDSNEIDVEEVSFRLTNEVGQCINSLGETSDVPAKVAWKSTDKEVQLIINKWDDDCEVFELDPHLGVVLSKLFSAGTGLQTVIAFAFMSFVAVFWI